MYPNNFPAGHTGLVRPAPCVLIAMLVAAGSASAQVWDAKKEFSVDNGNPNGAWSYGWMPVGFGEFTAFVNHGIFGVNPQWYGWSGDRCPSVWYNADSVAYNNIQPGEMSIHPGPGTEPIVVRWTAPQAFERDVRIVGHFGAGDWGRVLVGVRFNGVSAWEADDHGAFDLAAKVASGDTIDFVGYAGYGYGNTVLDASISAYCPADFNGDETSDFFDYLDYVAAFDAEDMAADFNRDGMIDFFDYLDFVAAFDIGCE
jgi:hypothetical protein